MTIGTSYHTTPSGIDVEVLYGIAEKVDALVTDDEIF